MNRRSTLFRLAAVLICISLPGIVREAKGWSGTSATVSATTKKSTKKSSAAKPPVKGTTGRTGRKTTSRRSRTAKSRIPKVAATPRSIKLTGAFHASEQLRPMAQQLAATRAPAAYSGVLSYAQSHLGEGAAAAYLALAHAYTLDHRYADAASNFAQAQRAGEALDDYAEYLGAQAIVQAGRPAEAYSILEHFPEQYPDSIFATEASVLLANAHLQQGDGKGALAVLTPLQNTPAADQVSFQYALGRAHQASGDANAAIAVFRKIYQTRPLTPEANDSAVQLQAMNSPLTTVERKLHADALFNAKRYTEAGAEYASIARIDSQLSQQDRDALAIYSAVCNLRLKRIDRREIERLPETNDDTAALKLYMLAELARNEDKRPEHDSLVSQLVLRFPGSRWLEEALYSSGNMYLLKSGASQAIYYYSTLYKMFPNSTYTPSAHWRAAWLSYRTRNYAEAARLMDEQLQRYPGGQEIPSALYWRGRMYEDEEHNFPQAANYYRKLTTLYADYYYANLARQRLSALGSQAEVPPTPALNATRRPPAPELSADLPENDIHLIKARLLANAALNEYIGPEIHASPTADEWGALAQAEIYVSFGEFTRALQSMKHSGTSFFTVPFDQVPPVYWHLLFPQPYWSDLVTNSIKSNLDPYLVASLIRQESEFNPSAVSPANAYGLMQLLPSVAKSLGKKHGIKRLEVRQLLNPTVNLELGTLNLRQVLDRFGGQVEYALAAYNAGDTPVRQWLSSNDYKDVPEFVESIPYTETREYVQAILRNREMYRQLYPLH
jgi:soluble lytic murein transglycosylase